MKENIDTEIQDFRPHFAGDIFLDEKVPESVTGAEHSYTLLLFFYLFLLLAQLFVLSLSANLLISFFSPQKSFYGQEPRRMGGLGLFRVGVWQNFGRAWKAGYQGNMKGEGFILGGVFVIGSGNQVIRAQPETTFSVL